jgi:hypothetical protein
VSFEVEKFWRAQPIVQEVGKFAQEVEKKVVPFGLYLQGPEEVVGH